MLGFSGWIAVDTICALQLLHLIPVARLYLPTVILRFLRIFKYLNFEDMTFGQWQFTRAIDQNGFSKNNSPVNYNFEKMGYNSKAFFSLTTGIWLYISIACFIPVLVSLFAIVMPKFSFAKNLEKNVLSIFFPIFIILPMMKLNFAAMLNYRYFNVETSSESAGSYGAVIYFIFLGTLFIFLWTMALYYWDDINQRRKQSGQLTFEEDIRKNNFKGTYLFYQFRVTHFFHYLYPLYFILRRFLVAQILVYWHDSSFYQLLFLSILSVVSLVWHTAYMPFRSRLRNVVHSIFEFGYLVLLMTLFPYVYPPMNSERFDKWPILVILVYGTIFYGGILTAIIGMYREMVEKEDDIPIIQETEASVVEGPANVDILREWKKGDDVVHIQ